MTLRHLILIFITLGIILSGFVLPNSASVSHLITPTNTSIYAVYRTPSYTKTPTLFPTPTMEVAFSVVVRKNITSLNIRTEPRLNASILRKAKSGECFTISPLFSAKLVNTYLFVPIVYPGRNVAWIAVQRGNEIWADIQFDIRCDP